jgi:hypothetical protein
LPPICGAPHAPVEPPGPATARFASALTVPLMVALPKTAKMTGLSPTMVSESVTVSAANGRRIIDGLPPPGMSTTRVGWFTMLPHQFVHVSLAESYVVPPQLKFTAGAMVVMLAGMKFDGV